MLVVDDDACGARAVAKVLAQHGALTTVVATNEAALASLTTGTLDAAVVDVHLPDGSGVELTSRFRCGERPIAALVLSADAAIDLAHEAVVRGALDYLVKPCPADRLALAVCRAVDTTKAWLSALARISGATLLDDPLTVTECRPRAAPMDRPQIRRFSPRQKQVVELLTKGLTRREMAEALQISERGVGAHVQRILAKSGFRSTRQLLTKLGGWDGAFPALSN